jgi:ATP-binding cassette, subfamily B, bacterial MsbA
MQSSPILILLRFIRPYWWVLPVLVLLGIAASAAEGLGIGLIIPALDLLLGAEPAEPAGRFARLMRGVTERAGDRSPLGVIGFLILALVALKTTLVAVEALVSTAVIGKVTRDLRVRLFRQMLAVGLQYHTRSDQGYLLNTIDVQTYRTSESLSALTGLITGLSMAAVFLVILLLLSWQMTVIVLVVAVPSTLLVRLLSSRARHWGGQFSRQHAQLTGRVVELLHGIRTIRLFNREDAEAERLAEAADAVRHSYVRAKSLVRILPAAFELIYLPVFILVVAYAVVTDVASSTVLAFLLLLYRLQSPLKRIDHARVSLAHNAAGIAEVERLLDRSGKPFLTAGRQPISRFELSVRFEGVTFRHVPEGTPSLEDVSFEIRRSSIVAIVGPSGSGKSTIVNLLCRFYDPAEGRILVDGMDLRDVNTTSWRQRIAFSGQDADLRSGSIADNIAFGKPDADDAEIRMAARLARAAEFIEALPNGYETQVGLRGQRLSGGERQRIALARALIRQPDILILDEATNAVDSVTESAIQDTLDSLAGKLTIVVIAHHFTALRRADHVVVVSGGRIVEQGTPAEMEHTGGTLTQLYGAAPPVLEADLHRDDASRQGRADGSAGRAVPP